MNRSLISSLSLCSVFAVACQPVAPDSGEIGYIISEERINVVPWQDELPIYFSAEIIQVDWDQKPCQYWMWGMAMQEHEEKSRESGFTVLEVRDDSMFGGAWYGVWTADPDAFPQEGDKFVIYTQANPDWDAPDYEFVYDSTAPHLTDTQDPGFVNKICVDANLDGSSGFRASGLN